MSKRRKTPKGLDRSTLIALERSQGWTSKRGDDLRSIAADKREPEMAYLAKKEIARRAAGGEYYHNDVIVRRDRSGARVVVRRNELALSGESLANYRRALAEEERSKRRGSASKKEKGFLDWLGELFS